MATKDIFHFELTDCVAIAVRFVGAGVDVVTRLHGPMPPRT